MQKSNYKRLSIKRLVTNPTCLNNFLKEQEWELYSNTPKIEKEPQLRDFNLSEEFSLEFQTNLQNKKKMVSIIFFVLCCVSLVIFFCFFSSSNYTFLDIFLMFLMSPFVVFCFFFPLNEFVLAIFMKKEREIEASYKKFLFTKNAYNWQQKLKERKYWEEMSGRDFEYAVANYFKGKGFAANITQCSNDGGIDIILTLNNEISYVQCKHYQKNVGIAPARELYGVMQANNVNQGYLVTLNGFTKNVYDFAKDKNIKLLTVDDILA